jgi:hypothetical protein
MASDRNSFFLHQWDWTRVNAILVMSLPGSHEEKEKLGMVSLAVQLRDKGWIPRSNETAVAEYQVSLSQWLYTYPELNPYNFRNVEF